jgi:hypothetical protein
MRDLQLFGCSPFESANTPTTGQKVGKRVIPSRRFAAREEYFASSKYRIESAVQYGSNFTLLYKRAPVPS